MCTTEPVVTACLKNKKNTIDSCFVNVFVNVNILYRKRQSTT